MFSEEAPSVGVSSEETVSEDGFSEELLSEELLSEELLSEESLGTSVCSVFEAGGTYLNGTGSILGERLNDGRAGESCEFGGLSL